MLETLPKLEFETISAGAKTTAVIVAAGSAVRMEGICKITAPICGIPAIVHTLRAYDRCDDIANVVLVAREDLIGKLQNCVKEFEILKPVQIVAGGDTRAQSALNGAVAAKCEFVAIADGARVLTTPELISRVCVAAYEFDAAIPAIKAIDTIKRAKNSVVDATLNRDEIVQVQTPQVIKRELYVNFAQKAIEQNLNFTDDAAILEHFGEIVRVVEGEKFNIKITTQDDINLAEFLLKMRGEGV